jgi:hypothetical protein
MVFLLRLIYVDGVALRVRESESMPSGWGFDLTVVESTEKRDDTIFAIGLMMLSREGLVRADRL